METKHRRRLEGSEKDVGGTEDVLWCNVVDCKEYDAICTAEMKKRVDYYIKSH